MTNEMNIQVRFFSFLDSLAHSLSLLLSLFYLFKQTGHFHLPILLWFGVVCIFRTRKKMNREEKGERVWFSFPFATVALAGFFFFRKLSPSNQKLFSYLCALAGVIATHSPSYHASQKSHAIQNSPTVYTRPQLGHGSPSPSA